MCYGILAWRVNEKSEVVLALAALPQFAFGNTAAEPPLNRVKKRPTFNFNEEEFLKNKEMLENLK